MGKAGDLNDGPARMRMGEFAEARESLRDKIAKHMRRLVFHLVPTKVYMRLYEADTDRRLRDDPVSGGIWSENELGSYQLPLLHRVGVEPHHRLLDFGIYTLASGANFIRYLDEGNYYGVDISTESIDVSRGRVEQESDLAAKRPTVALISADDERLDLPWTPDFVVAFSVFSHLPPEAALAAFRQIRSVMEPSTVFVFSYFEGQRRSRKSYKSFRYPFATMQRIALQAGIAIEQLEGQWLPTQQVLIGRVASDHRG